MSMSTTDIPVSSQASPAQLKFINSLFTAVQPKSDLPGVAEVILPVRNLLVLAMASITDPSKPVEIDKRDASRLIDALKLASQVVPSATIKWGKQGNTWVIKGDPAQLVAGNVVTVTSAKGEKDVIVDCVIGQDGPNAVATVIDERKEAKAKADAATVEVENLIAAFHARMDTSFVGVLLPTLDADATNTVAFWFVGESTVSLVLGGTGRVAQPLATQKSVIERLLALTDDEIRSAMQAYGQEMGTCGFCCRSLTNDLSRERGVGPVCWSKGSF